jgi:hypothetical protein
MIKPDTGIAQGPHDLEPGGNTGDTVKASPEGTVSLCEPIAITPSAGFLPSSLPIRLPDASIRVVSPASMNRCASQARPSRNKPVNERRV